MDPKQYRVGNLLRDKVSKTLLEVIELTKEDIVTHVIDRTMFPLKDGWGLEPIPLNDNLLLKFGFEQNWEDVDAFPTYHLESFVLDEKFQPIDSGFKIADYDLQFVHELQNFYFSIKNQELKLKQS
jgi:hypothetical protein